MAPRPKMLYVQTSGVDTPGRCFTAFFMASTAQAMEMEATIFFTMQGSSIACKGAAEKVKLLPESDNSLKDFLDQALEAGVKLMVCRQSLEQHRMQVEDLIPEAQVVGAATLNDMVLEMDHVFYF